MDGCVYVYDIAIYIFMSISIFLGRHCLKVREQMFPVGCKCYILQDYCT